MLEVSDGVVFLLESVKSHWILRWWNLNWKLVRVVDVLAWIQEELLELLLTRHDELVVLELDAEELATLLKLLVFFLESDWAIAEKLFVLGDDFSSFVSPKSQWHVSSARENDLISESLGISDENVSFFRVSEVEEEILVEDTVLGRLASIDVLLLILPGYRTEVAKLRDGLLEVGAVNVHVRHETRTLLTLTMMVVSRKVHSCPEVGLDRLQGNVLYEPARFHAINVGHVVVISLEEVDCLRQCLFHISEATGQNCTITSKFFLLEWLGALVHLLDRDVDG